MSLIPQNPISDELLSAYLDGAVTEEERRRVERAIAQDPVIAWQVETLRETIRLLQELPSIPLPRSFVLQEEQVADILVHYRAAAPAPSGPGVAGPAGRLWHRLWAFFQAGNPALRNAAAAAAALFVLLVTLNAVGVPAPPPATSTVPASAPEVAMASTASPQERETLSPAFMAPRSESMAPEAMEQAPAAAEPALAVGALAEEPQLRSRAMEPAPQAAPLASSGIPAPGGLADEAGASDLIPLAFAEEGPEAGAFLVATPNTAEPERALEVASVGELASEPAAVAASAEAEQVSSASLDREPRTAETGASGPENGLLASAWLWAEGILLGLALILGGLWLRSRRIG